MCYNPTIQGFEPYPHYIRMMADGLEAILDAYVYMRNKGEERPAWLAFLRKAADWLVRNQNEDGSFYRAYNTDGSIRMDSKANTPSVIRFLVQFYLVTGDEKYRRRRSERANGLTTTLTSIWNIGAAPAITWIFKIRKPASMRYLASSPCMT